MGVTRVLVTRTRQTPDIEALLADFPDDVEIRFLQSGELLDDRIAGVEVLYGQIDEPALRRADALRWVQHQSTGVDANLYPAFIDSDVILTSLGGAITSTVAEHAVAVLLALARNLHRQRDLMAARQWQAVPPTELAGLTLGILGLGRIGQGVARRAAPFEMRILALDPLPVDCPPEVEACWPLERLPEFLGTVDAVVVCCPSTPQTRHLIGTEQLAQMRPGSYLVNISRGDLIDPDALLESLRGGHLAGAGLDVTEPEPLPADSPLWSEPNLLLTPHSAGYSQNVHTRKIRWFADNLRRYLAGEPLLAVVDKRRGW